MDAVDDLAAALGRESSVAAAQRTLPEVEHWLHLHVLAAHAAGQHQDNTTDDDNGPVPPLCSMGVGALTVSLAGCALDRTQQHARAEQQPSPVSAVRLSSAEERNNSDRVVCDSPIRYFRLPVVTRRPNPNPNPP